MAAAVLKGGALNQTPEETAKHNLPQHPTLISTHGVLLFIKLAYHPYMTKAFDSLAFNLETAHMS